MSQPLDLDPNARVDFFITCYTPVSLGGTGDITISGVNLDQVTRVFTLGPNGRVTLKCDITSEQIVVPISSLDHIPGNTVVFILLSSESGAWWPVGPFVKEKA